MITTVMLCGVGGQGTILAADLLAKVALFAGLDVKLSEVHGMSQRGGSVDTVVRFGPQVLSPVTNYGHVDCLVAFEMIEARRQLPYLKHDGVFLVNDLIMPTLGIRSGKELLPESLYSDLVDAGAHVLNASNLAIEAGSTRSANVVLMGALSHHLPFSPDMWHSVIASRVPSKTIDANCEAFEIGRLTEVL